MPYWCKVGDQWSSERTRVVSTFRARRRVKKLKTFAGHTHFATLVIRVFKVSKLVGNLSYRKERQAEQVDSDC
jgi:hypothetical protein